MKNTNNPKNNLATELEEAKQRVSKLETLADKLNKQLTKAREGLRRRGAEHKQIEKSLRESTEKYQAIFREARNGIVLIDIDTGQIIDCNPEFAKQAGRRISTLKKMKIWQFRPSKKQEFAKDMFQEIREKGIGGSDELEFTKPSGEAVIIGFLSKKITIGGKDYLQSITWDITERRQAEIKLRRSESQLRLLSQRVLHVQEEERTRIAGELHDQLSQELVALKIEAVLLAEQLMDNSKLHERALALQNLTGRLIKTTNRLSFELRPEILDKLGLYRAIQWCAEDFEHRTGISCPTEFMNSDLKVPRATAIIAYRILQEALANVRWHAKASQVKVSVSQEDNSLILSIIDNGIGMDILQLDDGASLGLMGMRERANIVGGTFHINSEAGKGTSIRVCL